MLKYGKEAIIVATITGIFGTLSAFMKDKNLTVSLIAFVFAIIAVYTLIHKAMGKLNKGAGDPETHPVFYTLDKGLKVAIDMLPIVHEKKKALVAKYLKIKFNNIGDALLTTIKDGEIRELPKRINDAVHKTRDDIKGSAPELFCRKMIEWDNKYSTWTLEAMDTIIDSTYYSDDNSKFGACFDCVQVMAKATYAAIENTVTQMNGELEAYLEKNNNDTI